MTAKPPTRLGSFGWPRISRVIVGKEREPLTAMELARIIQKRRWKAAGMSADPHFIDPERR